MGRVVKGQVSKYSEEQQAAKFVLKRRQNETKSWQNVFMQGKGVGMGQRNENARLWHCMMYWSVPYFYLLAFCFFFLFLLSGAFEERSLVYSVLHFPENFNFEEIIINPIFFSTFIFWFVNKIKNFSVLYMQHIDVDIRHVPKDFPWVSQEMNNLILVTSTGQPLQRFFFYPACFFVCRDTEHSACL